jgi:CYTH domain-containing protein
MALNKTYTIKNKRLITLLDDVETIIGDLERFKSIHEGYSYSIDVSKSTKRNLWNAEVKIGYEEPEDKKRVVGIVEPPTVL